MLMALRWAATGKIMAAIAHDGAAQLDSSIYPMLLFPKGMCCIGFAW